jgi:peptidoglycan/LPS O-acetylase OafA/YrhL
MSGPGPAVADARLFDHAPEIDSLRAIAMIAVLAMHAKLVPFGWVGVWMFFVISGYVVTLSIVRRLDGGTSQPSLPRFYERRIARIVPVYYVYVAGGVLVSLALAVPQNSAALWSLFGFYQNAAMIAGQGEMEVWPTGHLWSISVEMQFYLVYGIAAHRLSPAAIRKLLWVFIFASPLLRAGVAAAMANGNHEAAAFAIYSGPTLHFDSFAMGCLLAHARLKQPIEQLAPPLIRLGLGVMTCYLSIYIIVNMWLRDRRGVEIVRDVISGILFGEGREIFLYTALGLLSLAILSMTLTRHPAIRWLTEMKLLQWIGTISYGAYIFHAFALCVAFWTLTGVWADFGAASLPQRLMAFVIGLALTLVMAQLSYRYLEQPIVRRAATLRRAKSPEAEEPAIS